MNNLPLRDNLGYTTPAGPMTWHTDCCQNDGQIEKKKEKKIEKICGWGFMIAKYNKKAVLKCYPMVIRLD